MVIKLVWTRDSEYSEYECEIVVQFQVHLFHQNGTMLFRNERVVPPPTTSSVIAGVYEQN